MAKKGTPGDIVQIPLGDGQYTYGQLLVDPYLAVYDVRTTEPLTDVSELDGKPALFVVAVYHRPITSGRWPVVGRLPDDRAPIEVPNYFMQDQFNPDSCKIIDVLGNMRPATPAECEGLERAAVWDAEHVEDRIRDTHAGRPNPHLEALKLRR